MYRESVRYSLACPQCGKDRTFKTKYSVQNAENKSTKCFSCRTAALNKQRDVSKVKNPAWKGYKDVPGKVLSKVKHNAKVRNINVDITLEDISFVYEKQNKLCALTGIPLDWNTNASVDRIDSSIGYYINNIQIVTKDINMMKKDIPNSEFIKLCIAVSAHNCEI